MIDRSSPYFGGLEQKVWLLCRHGYEAVNTVSSTVLGYSVKKRSTMTMSEYSNETDSTWRPDTVPVTLRRTPPCGHPISGHRPSLKTKEWNRCSGLAGNCRVGEGIKVSLEVPVPVLLASFASGLLLEVTSMYSEGSEHIHTTAKSRKSLVTLYLRNTQLQSLL